MISDSQSRRCFLKSLRFFYQRYHVANSRRTVKPFFVDVVPCNFVACTIDPCGVRAFCWRPKIGLSEIQRWIRRRQWTIRCSRNIPCAEIQEKSREEDRCNAGKSQVMSDECKTSMHQHVRFVDVYKRRGLSEYGWDTCVIRQYGTYFAIHCVESQIDDIQWKKRTETLCELISRAVSRATNIHEI